MFHQIRKISTSGKANHKIRSVVDVVFGKYLFATNTLTSGVCMIFGDLIEQEIHFGNKQDKKYRYDLKRLGTMFLVGLSLGVSHHYYYGYLNKLFPKRDLKTVGIKILADQFVASPLCIAQFFYTLAILQDKSLKETNEEICGKFVSVYTMDWCVWPPAQFFNFYLMPVRYQVAYINFVTMIYDVFLSYIKYDYVL